MGGWALGLAIAFCVPLATLVSIGLAIATLVQSRDGRDRGRGLAVAALVIDGLVLLGIVALVVIVLLAPTEPQRDTQGRVTERHEISAFDIREGDCLDDPALMAAGSDEIEVKQAEAVPCGQAHDVEAYLVFDLEGDDYPGRRQVVRRAAVGCLQGFEGFVGRQLPLLRRGVLDLLPAGAQLGAARRPRRRLPGRHPRREDHGHAGGQRAVTGSPDFPARAAESWHAPCRSDRQGES